jgi:hypothetical protein
VVFYGIVIVAALGFGAWFVRTTALAPVTTGG